MSPRRDERGGRRRPVGIERAERAEGAPPPRKREQKPPVEPDLPRSVQPDVPGWVMRELKRQADDPTQVARALTLAGDALADERPDRALPYLTWAKGQVPRSAAVREALGIALYRADDFASALSELQTYRRLTGRNDQNHLIADCLRATGRPPEKVGEVIEAMDVEVDGLDRVVEGVIVWASALADAGDVPAGRAVLDRVLEQVEHHKDEVPEQAVRLWYVAGDLADRAGDTETARHHFERLSLLEGDPLDAEERLERP